MKSPDGKVFEQMNHVQRLVLRGTASGLMLVAGVCAMASANPARAEIPFNPNIVADIAERVTPAVVNITTRRNRGGGAKNMPPGFKEFFGQRAPQMGAGSGVVVSSNGDIVTNNHVVDGADVITVTFADRREFTAKLVGTDKSSDLAFLKIDAKNLTFLPFGDSQKLRLGEFVLAIGNPFGVGQTVTMGIVSAKGRANIGIVEYEDFIQTDASINPGNSGGALVNLRGELVGINTAILSRSGGAQGIGFAVPASMVRPVKEQIAQYGRVRRGWLGVGIQDLTADIARQLGLDRINGVLISDVLANGPAAKAKLKPGDVVISVNGGPTNNSAQLRNRIALIGPGKQAKLVVVRNKKQLTLVVTLEEKEDNRQVAQTQKSSDDLLAGVKLSNLNRDARSRLRVPVRVKGVVVTKVDGGTPAERARLQAGDVIVEAGGQPVTTVSQLRKILAKEKTSILLRVFKRGTYRYVAVRR